MGATGHLVCCILFPRDVLSSIEQFRYMEDLEEAFHALWVLLYRPLYLSYMSPELDCDVLHLLTIQ